MSRLPIPKRLGVLAALVEGNSISSTVRMTGVAKHTILKLLEDMGCACAAYHHCHVRGLRVIRVCQCVLCGAPESQDAYVDAPVHPTDKRILKEDRKSRSCCTLHYLHYDYCRMHKTLRMTTAMEAGLADHI